MSTFSLQLGQFIEKTKADGDKVLRQATLSMLNGVVKRSPVDTGRFRGNWQTTVGNPASGDLDTEDKSGGATLTAGVTAVAGAQMGDTTYIVNNLPYARRLEDGYSDQAPQGMVKLTVNEFKKYVDQAIQQVRA